MALSFSRLFFLALTVTVSFSQSIFVVKAPKQPFTAYPKTEKIKLNVGLELYPPGPLQWAYLGPQEGTTWVLCLNPAIEKNSLHLARQLFTKVTVITNTDSASLSKFDAILGTTHPSLGRGAMTEGKTTARSADIMFSWYLLVPHGSFQREIWSAEIFGGSSFLANASPEKLVQTALFDAFRKSHEILRTSPAIKTLAKKPAR